MASQEELFHLMKKWTNEEMMSFSNTLQNKSFALQNDSLKKLFSGSNENIWLYIATHVYSRPTIRKIKNDLQKHQNSTTETEDSEVKRQYISKKDILTHRMRSLSSRKDFLKRQVLDLEKEVTGLNEKYQTLQIDVGKSANILAGLGEAEHVLKEKMTFYRNTKKSVFYENNLKPFSSNLPKFVNYSGLCNFYNKSESVSTNDSRLWTDVENIVKKMSDFYQKLMEDIDINLPSQKSKLKASIVNILAAHNVQGICESVHQQSQQVANILESAFSLKQLNFDLQNPNNAASTGLSSSINEIQKMKVSQLESFMTKQHAVLEKDRLKEKADLAVAECIDSVSPLKTSLFEVDMQIHLKVVQCKKIKEMINHSKEIEKRLEVCSSEEQRKKDEISRLQKHIVGARDTLCEFLYQNRLLITNLDKTIFYGECLFTLQTERASLAKYAFKLFYDVPLEKDRSANSCSAHTLSLEEFIADGTLILSFQDNSAALEKCLKVIHHPSKNVTEYRQKTVEKMQPLKGECIPINVEICGTKEEILEPSVSMLFVVKETTKKTDSIFEELESNIQNWWKQPAQFIPKIMIEKKTLHQWKNSVSTS